MPAGFAAARIRLPDGKPPSDLSREPAHFNDDEIHQSYVDPTSLVRACMRARQWDLQESKTP